MRTIVASLALLLFARTTFADNEDVSPKRPVPNYDGRGPDPSNEDGAGTWTARILLSPLYFTSEYLLRRPIGALLTLSEHADVPHRLYDFFAFGPDHKIGFIPVGYLQFGSFASVGIYGFWDDAIVKRNQVRLHYEAWPADLYYATITDRYHFDDARTMQLRVVGFHRPDMLFYGLHYNSLQSSQSRYAESYFDLSATFDERFWRASTVEGRVGLRKVDTTSGHFGADPSLTQESSTGVFAVPYGFDRDYLAPYTSLQLTFDTRRPKAKTGSGVRLEVASEQGADAMHGGASSWIRYGATGGVYIDLNDHGRILGFKVGALFADPLSNGQVPFTELVTLGGDKWLRGYFPGRLVDRSAAVAEVNYMWPIAPSFDATIQAAVGNVFGEHLEDFQPSRLRFSGAFGFASKLGDPPLEFLIGFGTETFDHGAQVDSFRLTVGVPHSF